LQYFSPHFIRENIVGDNSLFAKVSSGLLEKAAVKWPMVIRINPEHHDFAPAFGKHGALTVVQGRDYSESVGKV